MTDPDLLKKLFIPRQVVLNCYLKHKLSSESVNRRTCWSCGMELDFWEYCYQFKDNDIEKAIILWQDDRIEFYCCKCFTQKNLEKERSPKTKTIPVPSARHESL